MRFLIDENVGSSVARWLAASGHDIFSVYDQARGIDDLTVMDLARSEHRIVITADKDFGENVFRQHIPHCGIVLLRLDDERSASKIAILQKLMEGHSAALADQFVVVTERQVRFASPRQVTPENSKGI
jgi:predicted nuclease of predicted toxin-antitoxin system